MSLEEAAEEGVGEEEKEERERKWKSKRAGQNCLARPFYFERDGQC